MQKGHKAMRILHLLKAKKYTVQEHAFYKSEEIKRKKT
jgi:hypothetical protein